MHSSRSHVARRQRKSGELPLDIQVPLRPVAALGINSISPVVSVLRLSKGDLVGIAGDRGFTRLPCRRREGPYDPATQKINLGRISNIPNPGLDSGLAVFERSQAKPSVERSS